MRSSFEVKFDLRPDLLAAFFGLAALGELLLLELESVPIVVQIRKRVDATITVQLYSKPCRHAHTCGSAQPAGIVATGTRVGSKR